MQDRNERLRSHLRRRPFAVLGYSAEGSVWCPACLRFAGGLSPDRPDCDGRPIIPLYARDPTVREEVCEHCHTPLLDLMPAGGSPNVLKIHRLRCEHDSTVVHHDPVGTIVLGTDGCGAVYFNLLEERFVVSPDDRSSSLDTKPAPVNARSPVIHRRSATLS